MTKSNGTGYKIQLRDQFAIKAMEIAIRLFENDYEKELPYLDETGYPMDDKEGSIGVWFPNTKHFSELCYAIADSMMNARNE